MWQSSSVSTSHCSTLYLDDTEVSEMEARDINIAEKDGAEGKVGGVKEEGVAGEVGGVQEQNVKKKRQRKKSRKKQWAPGLKECSIRVMAK